ncbi:unnamed protein product [Oncorhynchus mykiss]|uniref:Apple domain-containing protein n=1 Tax=Oncorhynchus mykiss TaxID=8022 RepID=A0A060XME5_ONCMY|nr:unnamed protein product [Oncorhynchus mykiss]
MWIYNIIFTLLIVRYSECRRNALQDYKRSDGVRLVQLPDSALHTKSRKLSIVKCARGCSRNKILLFTCRAFLYDQKNRKCQWLSFDRNSPGVQSQHDFNYQLYQKKGIVHYLPVFLSFCPPALSPFSLYCQ